MAGRAENWRLAGGAAVFIRLCIGRAEYAVYLICRERIQTDIVDAVENAFFNIRIIPLQTAKQRLDAKMQGDCQKTMLFCRQ